MKSEQQFLDHLQLKTLEYPFDQYQRYQDVKVVIDIIQSREPDQRLDILDVGGSPTALQFLADYDVFTTNLEMGDGVQLQSDGVKLPFADRSFDVVITVDTLEHVANDQRRKFVDEILRVTNSYVIITGPFANGYNEASEMILDNFLVEICGLQHRFLTEHLQNGLPSLDACLRWISEITENYITVPSGYLHHWLPLMIIKHYLGRLSNSAQFLREIDRLYNYQNYWRDHRLPSYRQIVVATKKNQDSIFREIKRTFEANRETQSTDLNGVIALWQAIHWTRILEEQENEIRYLKDETERLGEVIFKYQSGRFIRFMAAVHKFTKFAKKKIQC